MRYSATYSPDDNKLRLYASSRLDSETYARVKSAGFKWAPRQDLFVAPMWTPSREDLLLDLAGEIGDEDSTLIDRAEDRAERFEEYREKRTAEAHRARESVAAIAEGIPFGQPILVGHHSERRARKDAERIESGMRKAIKLWDTATYWTDRAAGAIRHAKYKELPAVRHRRIKGIEADLRKVQKEKADAEKLLAAWSLPNLSLAGARRIAGADYGRFRLTVERKPGDAWGLSAYDVLRDDPPAWTVEAVVEKAKEAYPRTIAHQERWIAHYENRLAYERAMLADQLGLDAGQGMADRFDIKPGGKVDAGGDRGLLVLRVNKSGGKISGVTTQAPSGVHWRGTWKFSIEEIRAYEPPAEGMAEKVKKATALPLLCNYPGEGFREMTDAEWKAVDRWSDFPYIGTKAATETTSRHRVRQMPGKNFWDKVQVVLTDAKRVDPPTPEAAAKPEPLLPSPRREQPKERPARKEAPEGAADFETIRAALKGGGVQVAIAPQLFPTPPEIARRMAQMAELASCARVLEPSAGTGNLITAIMADCGDPEIVALEINQGLANQLASKFPRAKVSQADFLATSQAHLGGPFDAILMNPPFAGGADIRHIAHAATMLRPGGILVAICANGPRQQEKLKPQATYWEPLPAGTFEGTSVSAALLVIER